MAKEDSFFWCVRAGESGQADSVFLKQNSLAIGWCQVGDLTEIGHDREALKKRIAQTYPERKPGAIPGDAGMLYRFVHEMKDGDLVLYPSKVDRLIHIGRVAGPYRYDPKVREEFPNLRPVKWEKSFNRTQFSQGALYETNSILTLFQVRNYADEFVAALEGKTTEPGPEEGPGDFVAEQIEQNTRDFILKTLSKELKGHPLAHFVAQLLEVMGYQTRVAPVGPDTGVDILAHKDELGFEPPIIKVQVKSTGGSIGIEAVQALKGNMVANEFGLFVTLGVFTNQAKSFALGKSNLRLVDGIELVDLVLQHYAQLDSRYKGLIPLRKVYVPEPPEGVEE